jgi:hypothetical protein
MNLLLTKLTAQILINRDTCISLYITHKNLDEKTYVGNAMKQGDENNTWK